MSCWFHFSNRSSQLFETSSLRSHAGSDQELKPEANQKQCVIQVQFDRICFSLIPIDDSQAITPNTSKEYTGAYFRVVSTFMNSVCYFLICGSSLPLNFWNSPHCWRSLIFWNYIFLLSFPFGYQASQILSSPLRILQNTTYTEILNHPVICVWFHGKKGFPIIIQANDAEILWQTPIVLRWALWSVV